MVVPESMREGWHLLDKFFEEVLSDTFWGRRDIMAITENVFEIGHDPRKKAAGFWVKCGWIVRMDQARIMLYPEERDFIMTVEGVQFPHEEGVEGSSNEGYASHRQEQREPRGETVARLQAVRNLESREIFAVTGAEKVSQMAQ